MYKNTLISPFNLYMVRFTDSWNTLWAWRPLFRVRVVFSPPFRKGRGLDRDKPPDLSGKN